MVVPLRINIGPVTDVITALDKASSDIEAELAGLQTDVNAHLDESKWSDTARNTYTEKQLYWNKTAAGMHTMLTEANITLGNMVENITTTEAANQRAWSSVFNN